MATTNPYDQNRDMIKRVKYVCDQILGMFPNKSDMRFKAMRTMMYESLKDLALVPDEQISMMANDMRNALDFIGNGSMEELEEALRQAAENAGN